jgi:hypothetical protein
MRPLATVRGAREAPIRHELVHVATGRLGIDGGTWLSEGIAHAVAEIPIAEERFVVDPAPEALIRAARLPKQERDFARLLAWRQSFPGTSADGHARCPSRSWPS